MHMICQMSYNLCKISIYIYGATRLEQLVLYNRPPEKKKKTSNFQSHASLREETSFCFLVFCVWFWEDRKKEEEDLENGRRVSWSSRGGKGESWAVSREGHTFCDCCVLCCCHWRFHFWVWYWNFRYLFHLFLS